MKKTPFILLIVNIIAFSIIGGLFFYISQKEKTPVAVLAPHISMGTVTINVGNLVEMKNFYKVLLGMQVLSENKNMVILGYNNQGILEFTNTPQLSKSSSSDPGLDQLAIVFNSRAGLARTLQRVLRQNPSLYLGGTSRGAIGEAFYVTDPQGNTLELYYDTDPSTWPRSSRGNVEGDALPIDIATYIQQYAEQPGDNGMKIGHIQLRIGNMTEGRDFYINTLGLYPIPQLGGNGNSLFMSDGYYHHDVVINQAQGYDGDSVKKYQGLQGFEINLPNNGYIESLKERLDAANIKYIEHGQTLTFDDPWGITLSIRSLNMPFWLNLF